MYITGKINQTSAKNLSELLEELGISDSQISSVLYNKKIDLSASGYDYSIKRVRNRSNNRMLEVRKYVKYTDGSMNLSSDYENKVTVFYMEDESDDYG